MAQAGFFPNNECNPDAIVGLFWVLGALVQINLVYLKEKTGFILLNHVKFELEQTLKGKGWITVE
ncbi:MAG: hypothetical protein J6L88_04975 [Clostridia bacterium]|nr:hypothetical protein [Clostridia bacterium]